jgi:hypothetical protein
MRIEGRIIVCFDQPMFLLCPHADTDQGFDEFMNVVIDEATEVYVKEAKPRRELGKQLCLISMSTL